LQINQDQAFHDRSFIISKLFGCIEGPGPSLDLAFELLLGLFSLHQRIHDQLVGDVVLEDVGDLGHRLPSDLVGGKSTGAEECQADHGHRDQCSHRLTMFDLRPCRMVRVMTGQDLSSLNFPCKVCRLAVERNPGKPAFRKYVDLRDDLLIRMQHSQGDHSQVRVTQVLHKDRRAAIFTETPHALFGRPVARQVVLTGGNPEVLCGDNQVRREGVAAQLTAVAAVTVDDIGPLGINIKPDQAATAIPE
jgi:hypothetical protein